LITDVFQLYPEDPLPKTVCIDCCAKLNQYFDFFETSSRAQLSLQILFDPKLVASSKKELKKEPELEPEPGREPKLEPFELPNCIPKTKVEEEEENDEDDEDDDDDEDVDSANDSDPPPECTVADEVC
jgi:hypothetical protein